MSDLYILGADGRTPVAVDGILEWGRWFDGRDDRRRVAWTDLAPGGLDFVSTVFLGIDHSHGRPGGPLLFETMACRAGECGDQDRYATWDEAVAGHEAMVAAEKAKDAEKATEVSP